MGHRIWRAASPFMTVFALSAAYVACIICIGASALKALPGERRHVSGGQTAAAFALGCGILSTALFWMSMAGIRPTRMSVGGAAILLSLCFYGAYRAKHGPAVVVDPGGGPFISGMLFIAALFGLAFVAFASVGVPLYEWDAIAIWGLKAKAVYHEPVREAAYFHDLTKSYSHLDYPLGVPFLTAGVYAMLGGVNDIWGKSILPCVYLAFVFLIFSFLCGILDRWCALSLSAAAAFTPAVIRWAGAGTADSVLMMYITGAVVFLCRWLEKGRGADIILAILFSSFCVFTKHEGLPFSLALGISLGLVSPRGRRRWAFVFLLGVMAASLPWFGFLQNLPQTKENYWMRATPAHMIPNLDRLKVILPAFAEELVRFNNWGGVWVLLAASAAIGIQAFRESPTRLLWFTLFQMACIYLLAYVVTPHDAKDLIDVSLTRLCIHLLPAALLLTGIHLGAFLKSTRG